ncbi:MAG TPA: thioesterase family protein [Spirochaetota bacterium]|nr:thioesterase family protein [Spirochaetota bacterium]HPQ54232.1 thioesterase family protein [Spirochaetota bacterium]
MNPLQLYPAVTSIDVRWSDMDAFGHVNNNIYYRYFEAARFTYYGKLGILDLKHEENIGPIMAESSCRYLNPLSFPDRLTVGSRISAVGKTSFTMEFIIISEKAGTAATGKAVLVMFDYTQGKKIPLPASLKESIQNIEKGNTGKDIS